MALGSRVMDTRGKHTVTAFDEELRALRAMLLDLSARTTDALDDAMRALRSRDRELALRVVVADREIDGLHTRAEAAAVNIIALRAPMADDLREIVASIKIAALLERTADYARNIARRVPRIDSALPDAADALVGRMQREAGAMLGDVVTAFAARDAAAARAIRARDEGLDALYEDLTRALVELMIERPDRITGATHLLFIGKHLERIGDQATNIAEMVIYAATGEQLAARDTGLDRLAA